MTVNDALLALLRPKPNQTQLTNEPTDIPAAAQTPVDAPDRPEHQPRPGRIAASPVQERFF
ncbi:hypothetical protein [Streptomyces sp. NPDC093598]|uniref:hypothetical protein n=1 Tax=Streptomyces sp. NPDC093598 TaxID=3366046 RepID=UPI003816AE47